MKCVLRLAEPDARCEKLQHLISEEPAKEGAVDVHMDRNCLLLASGKKSFSDLFTFHAALVLGLNTFRPRGRSISRKISGIRGLVVIHFILVLKYPRSSSRLSRSVQGTF